MISKMDYGDRGQLQASAQQGCCLGPWCRAAPDPGESAAACRCLECTHRPVDVKFVFRILSFTTVHPDKEAMLTDGTLQQLPIVQASIDATARISIELWSSDGLDI
jgi:hypothetical protein